MNSCELITYVSTISCILAKNYSQDELALLSAILSQLSVSLATILANEQATNPNVSEPDITELL